MCLLNADQVISFKKCRVDQTSPDHVYLSLIFSLRALLLIDQDRHHVLIEQQIIDPPSTQGQLQTSCSSTVAPFLFLCLSCLRGLCAASQNSLQLI